MNTQTPAKPLKDTASRNTPADKTSSPGNASDKATCGCDHPHQSPAETVERAPKDEL